MAYVPPYRRELLGERSGDRQHQTVNFEKTDNLCTSLYGGEQLKELLGSEEREHQFEGVVFVLGGSGQNNVWSSDVLTVEVPQLSKVTSVHTLMNCGWGQKSAVIGSIQFNFTNGSSCVEEITVGKNVRDHYQGKFHNSLTEKYVTEVMSPVAPHWTRLDMQTWVFPREFHDKYLLNILITSTGGEPMGKIELFALTITRTKDVDV